MKHSNNSNIDWAQNQSTAIDLLRFPLAIAVIFIHMNPVTASLPDADFPILSGHGIYNIVSITLSHVLTQIAVPTFFLISGFLFFANFRKWSYIGYKNKMRSRIKTLVIPYILWNILAVGFVIIQKIAGVLIYGNAWKGVLDYIQKQNWHIFIDYQAWGLSQVNILGWPAYSTGPFNVPLWFVRDLIVVCVLAPAIYLIIKKTGLWGIFILFAAYLTRIWTIIPGFSITAIFYFALGAYFAVNGKNIVLFARKYCMITIPVSFLFFIACVIFDGRSTVVGYYLMPFYIVTAVFVAFYLASYLVEKKNMKPKALLVKSCFFVFAAHTVGSPMSLSQSIIHKIIPGTSGLEDGICYLLTPFCAAAICVMIYYVLSRYAPRVTTLLTGR